MQTEFDAIFYDLGGTLRLVERDAAFEAQARRRIAELCGETGDPDEFCKFLDYRYEGYRKWCFETMREATEAELWTRWLAPEYPREIILKNAVELTIEYRNKDGRRVVAEKTARGRFGSCMTTATNSASFRTSSRLKRFRTGWNTTT